MGLFAAASAIAQAPELAALPASAPDAVMYLEPSLAEPGHRTFLHVRYPEQAMSGTPLEFEVEFRSVNEGTPIDSLIGGSAALSVFGQVRRGTAQAGGDPIATSFEATPITAVTIPLPLISPEADRCRFTWDASALAPGDYILRFELRRTDEACIASQDILLQKLATAPLRESLAHRQAAVRGLVTHLQGLGVTGDALPQATLRLAIAEDASQIADTAISNGDWVRAESISRFLARQSDRIRAELTFDSSSPEWSTPLNFPDLSTVEFRDGGLYAAGQPVFLFGTRLPENATAADFDRLVRYGLRLVSLPAETVTSAQLAELESRNLSLLALLNDQRTEQADDEYRVLVQQIGQDGADARFEARVSAAMEHLRGSNRVLAVSLATRPRFVFEGEPFRENFVDFVNAAYNDVFKVNLAWKTRYKTFADIKIEPENPLAIYQYDLQTYQQQAGAAVFARGAAIAQRVLGSQKMTVGLSDDILEPGKTRNGIEQQSILENVSVSGCAITHSVDTPAKDAFVHSNFMYSLFHSMAPQHPIVTVSQRFIDRGPTFTNRSGAFVHALAWDSAMSGMNAMVVENWDVLNGNAGPWRDAMSTPDALDGLATANIEINRFAKIIRAFQQRESRIGIVWSQSSQIYDDGTPFLPSIRRAFAGAACAGQPVRFVSEPQCAAGALDSLDVVIIPQMLTMPAVTRQALEDYIQRGGLMIRTTTPIPYDARGQSQHGAMTYTDEILLIRGGEDEPRHYLSALDSLYWNGKLPEVPRLINSYGYPFEGVRTLTAEVDGKTYLYALNMREESVPCMTNGAWTTGRNLLTGRRMEFPTMLPPLTPILLELDPPTDGRPFVENGPRHPSQLAPAPTAPKEVPSATLPPVASAQLAPPAKGQ